MIVLVDLPKLSQSQAAMSAAYRSSLLLQERGWMRYPAARWDRPAVVAMIGELCVGGIQWTADDDDLTLSVDFAWAEPDQPRVFAMLLSRFRSKFRASPYTEVRFMCHSANEPMAKAVRALGLAPLAHSYRVTF